MDVNAAAKSYFKRIFQEVSGLKVVLLDKETISIVSSCLTQTELLENQVYLTEVLENQRENVRHLKCVAFIRPTKLHIRLLCEEIRNPKYAEYHLYFTNIVSRSLLERIAESDDFEAVKSVQEYFLDYEVVNSDFASFAMPHVLGTAKDTWDENALERVHQGVVSLLLSLKKNPVIRYDANSDMCLKLAGQISYTIQQELQLFNFRKSDVDPLLLILDRKNDPVTPLLMQWTYQAMVHDLFGIQNGRVTLPNTSDASQEPQEFVLNPFQDNFYQETMLNNFGDLGIKIKNYVSQLQSKSSKKASDIETIDDMKQFLEAYPDYKKLSGNVSKHVALLSELSNRVQHDNLLELGELEQSLACNDSQSSDFTAIQAALMSTVPDTLKLCLVCLYALRYEKDFPGNVKTLQALLVANLSNPMSASCVPVLLSLCGKQARQDEIFPSSNIFSKAARSGLHGLRGVENVYTQHVPFLKVILTDILNGKPRTATQPYASTVNTAIIKKPQDIIVVIVGGATFEEAKIVSELNAAQNGTRIVLASNAVLNCNMFVNDLLRSAQTIGNE
ncbi:vacuolar sorting protein Vps45 [Schizosaccharomyces japonicus yFS275]|uniref:Vacuolar sorting protein Vps45 n=1 Tax=Schizosaccharomyces japonicus (strain yFS275 / FY16936) TaxID=402676 RepID=B6K5B9_SCHJY|nr:vacuolar sorting protein Vps45 [Schizosaccharomyces japonicus yFS275]EEB08723.1 vacuolar sorting protein Vps45 [Schizosaccharomyces japonicus yFS275]